VAGEVDRLVTERARQIERIARQVEPAEGGEVAVVRIT
jgi:hypothetical protein